MPWVLFYDGECAFCSKSARLVARLDRKARIFFAPLQGELAGKLGLSHYTSVDGGTMVVLRESDGMVFSHSDAWIELARALGGGWRILAAVRFLPKQFRDRLYGWIARNRFGLAGRVDTCALPDPEVAKRLRN